MAMSLQEDCGCSCVGAARTTQDAGPVLRRDPIQACLPAHRKYKRACRNRRLHLRPDRPHNRPISARFPWGVEVAFGEELVTVVTLRRRKCNEGSTNPAPIAPSERHSPKW